MGGMPKKSEESARIKMRTCLDELKFLRNRMENVGDEMKKKLVKTGID